MFHPTVKSFVPAALLLAGLLAASSCRRQPAPTAPVPKQELQKTAQPAGTPGAPPAVPPIAALHHAAQEMALDGFQFGKKSLGWPFDAGVKSSSDYFALLIKSNYLTENDAATSAGILISNLSDSDPGETAFARTAHGVSPAVVVRKDGHTQTFADSSGIDAFAPPPPREPAWLP